MPNKAIQIPINKKIMTSEEAIYKIFICTTFIDGSIDEQEMLSVTTLANTIMEISEETQEAVFTEVSNLNLSNKDSISKWVEPAIVYFNDAADEIKKTILFAVGVISATDGVAHPNELGLIKFMKIMWKV